MAGRPIQIAEPITSEMGDDESERFRFNYNLPHLISSPERLANAKIVVISVAGAFRKGKSFLLNFFLRYLRALSDGNTRDWIRSDSDLEGGFHWRSGSDRDTAGILIWSEPFFIRKPNGEEVAVLLMDTQGTFDHQSTQQDCTTIFAFSTLLSSVQIFNISKDIQETDLQYLRLFVEFAAMAKGSRERVLQHLWFLVRDWQNPDELDYGVEGGRQYLEKVLACDAGKPRENLELRRGIRERFEKASCCLLPHPGKAVTRKTFRGAVSELDSDFVENLTTFVASILSPNNLVVKTVNGKELTGQELFKLVEVYYSAFRFGKLPTPKSIFTATVEMANQTAAADALKFFEDRMQSLCDPTKAISDQELDDLLRLILEQAMGQFDSKCMERESHDTAGIRKKLEEQLLGLFQQQHVLNKLKSDRIGAEEKNRMLTDVIKRMQTESLAAANKMCELERQFTEKVQKLQSKTKEEIEKLQEEMVKHTVEKKDLEKRNEELMRRIEDMSRRNKKLELRDGERREEQEAMAEYLHQMAEKAIEQQSAAGQSESILEQIFPVAAGLAKVVTTIASRCSIS